ncbi:hypothetical protein [Streptomyces spiramyceticus]|uniref:hypothetical protein n=1 Tax=Streptomyces spiramyceticus TaxID=299717 RepID=UPI00237BC5D5|nr:hypothetical protein [Streptomyces spiramyceticus]
MTEQTNPSEQPAEATATCWCVIAHPQTDEERARVQAALENARATNDANGVVLAIAQLTQPCPARRNESKR